MNKYVINLLLFLSGILVIFISYCSMGWIELLQYRVIKITSDVAFIQFALIVLRFVMSLVKSLIPCVFAIGGLYLVTSWFLNLQMSYKSKHIMSFSIFIFLTVSFLLLMGFSPDPVAFSQFKFIEAFQNCDIKKYLELFNVQGIENFIKVLLTYLFEFIFHIVLLIVLVYCSFFAAHKLHNDYGYYY